MENLAKDSGGTVTSDMNEIYKCLLMDFLNFDCSSRGTNGECHGLFSLQMSELLLGTFGHAIPHPAEGLAWPLPSLSVQWVSKKESEVAQSCPTLWPHGL